MGHDDGHGVGAFALFVDEVDALALDGGVEVGEGVEAGLGFAPVETVAPVGDQFLDVVQVGAVIPFGAGDFVGPAHVGQPVLQVFQYIIRNGYRVGLRRHVKPPQGVAFSLVGRHHTKKRVNTWFATR